jgi:hypothetical protein
MEPTRNSYNVMLACTLSVAPYALSFCNMLRRLQPHDENKQVTYGLVPKSLSVRALWS